MVHSLKQISFSVVCVVSDNKCLITFTIAIVRSENQKRFICTRFAVEC